MLSQMTLYSICLQSVCWLNLVVPTSFSNSTLGLEELGHEDKYIKEIKEVSATDAAFAKSGFRKPIEIGKLKDAKIYLSKKSLESIGKDFDFEKRKLVLFAWRGSGRDRIEYDVAESLPPQMQIRLKRGLTRDLRTHVKLYSLDKDVKWKIVKER